MPILGAFMGGETSPVAAGSTDVDIVFTTEDGRNLNGSVVSFTGGPQTYSVTLGSTGRATVTVASGYSYTAKITPSGGKYSNLNDQSFYAESMGRISISFVGLIVSDTLAVSFSAPLNMAYSRATLQITSPSGIVSSSSLTGSTTVTTVSELGEYSYTLTYLGASVNGTFMVDRSGSVIVDLTPNFVNLTVNVASIITDSGMTPTIASIPISETGNPAAVISGGMYRVSASGTAPKYSNGSSLFSVSNNSVTPTGDTSVSVTAFPNRVIITSSITGFTVPKSGSYSVMCFGGGGGGYKGGGAGGYMKKSSLSLTAGTAYDITIGAGGKSSTSGSAQSGGATSFGTLLSASGGGSGYVGGGRGGSGGGGGMGGSGGIGEYGGGGGGGGGHSYDDYWGADGGQGGTYGGGGGAGGVPESGVKGGAGKNGSYSGGASNYGGGGGGGYSKSGSASTSSKGGDGGAGLNTNSMSVDFKGSGSAGKGASKTASSNDPAGGGGGGYGGNGGNGGTGTREAYSGGSISLIGGGGGGGGGYGGNVGNGASYRTSNGSYTVGGGGGGGYGAKGGDGGTYGGGGGGYGSSGYGGSGSYASGGTRSKDGGSGLVIIQVVL